MENYLSSLGFDVWDSVTQGYTLAPKCPSTPDEEKAYGRNAKAKNAILCGLTNEILVKVMHYKSAKEVWNKLVSIYQGDDKIKEAKLQQLRTIFESLKMNEEEKIEEYFLRVDEKINSMRGLGETIEDKIVIKKVLRSLPSRYDSKVTVIEEAKDLKKISVDELHGSLTTYEMRIQNDLPSSKETAFKIVKKYKALDSECEDLNEDELNLVRKLKRGSRKYRRKLLSNALIVVM